MDVAAAGFTASQIASAQRGQQKQDQNVANLLTEAVGAAKRATAAAPSAPESAPPLDSSQSGPSAAGGRPAGRGSLINILA